MKSTGEGPLSGARLRNAVGLKAVFQVSAVVRWTLKTSECAEQDRADERERDERGQHIQPQS
jgi:hypothetical protein